jgi:hypothetical protein
MMRGLRGLITGAVFGCHSPQSRRFHLLLIPTTGISFASFIVSTVYIMLGVSDYRTSKTYAARPYV